MFRSMRRKNQLLAPEITESICQKASTGIMAVLGDDGYPYTVPLNFAYEPGHFYFHCAKTGHKMDALKQDNKVSFCIVLQDTIVPQVFATNYQSIVAFGKAQEVTDDAEKLRILRLLNQKYAIHLPKEGEVEIKKSWDHVAIMDIIIEHITGKEASETVKHSAGQKPHPTL